jgi:acetylornithine/N-succinyldiaminopimelate aminotransferase
MFLTFVNHLFLMKDYMKEEQKFIAQTYTRQPVVMVSGKGAILTDSEGKKYIDGFSGIAVNNVGHCHPKVVEAIQKQVAKLIHTSNVYYTDPQIKLAKLLYAISGGYQSFFCNSGAEANEAAIKLVRKHTRKSDIITAANSFHGRTITTLSATGQEKYKKGFEPLCKEFKHVLYGDVEAIKEATTEKTAAVLLEPIQGEGGVVVPPEGYLKEVAKFCKKTGLLLVLDEVQTGFGRTGEMFAWQAEGVEPDIFTVAKALGGGMPIGAMLAKKEVMSAFERGDHASTFGGNPVTSAAAVASIEVICEEKLDQRAKEMGRHLIQGLEELKNRYSYIKEVRGRGLMIGVELDIPCQEVADKTRERGLLLNCVHDNTLRFTPPLIIERETINEALRILNDVFAGVRHG